MKERLREIDLLKAVSALAVIAIHITGPYVYTSKISYHINQVMRFAVPMFVLISGLLLWNTDSKYNGIRGYYEFLKGRFKKVVIPYMLWSLIYILFKTRNELSVICTEKEKFISDTFNKLLYGTAYDHLYFVIIIMQLYILYIILRNVLKRAPKVTLIISFFITLFFQTGVYMQLLNLVKLPPCIIPYYIFFPTWIFYFVFGMYFSMNADKWIEKHRSKIVLLGIIWFVSLVIMMIDNKYTKTFYSSIKPSVMLYSITTFIFFYTVARLFRQCKWKVWKIPEWISVQSYNIYLSHLFVLNLIKLYIENHGSGVFWQRTRGMAVLYIMTVLFTFAFVYVISLIPFAGLLGGARIRLGSRYHEANKV